MKISKIIYLYITFSFVCSSYELLAQDTVMINQARLFRQQQKHQEGVAFLKKYLKTLPKEDTATLIKVYDYLGNYYNYSNLNKIDSCIYFFNKNLVLAEQVKDTLTFAFTYLDLGTTYFRLKDYKKSTQYLKQAIRHYKSINHRNGATRSLSVLSHVYLQQRNYQRALLYQQQCIKIFEAYLPQDHRFIISAKHNLGAIHAKLNNHREAINYVLVAYEYYKHQNDLATTQQIQLDLGFLYQAYNKHDSALYYAQKALAETTPNDHYSLTWVYSIMHEVAAKQKEYTAALEYGKLSLKHALLAFGSRSSDVAYAYLYLANIYNFKQEYEKAVAYTQKALMANHKKFSDSSVQANPPLAGALSVEYQLLFLEKKAFYLHQFYKASKDAKVLEESQRVFSFTISTIDSLRLTYRVPQNLLIHNKINAPIYTQAVSQLFDNYLVSKNKETLQKAFNYIEQNRAFLLNRILLEQQQLFPVAVESNSLIQQYEQQRDNIVLLEKNINSTKITTSEKNKELEQLQAQLVAAQQTQEEIVENLKTTQPAYYQQYFHTPTLELEQLQKHLKKHEAFVAYSVQGEEVSILKIKPNGVGFYQTTSTDTIGTLVTALREAILTKNDAQYLAMAYQLYKYLIAPLALEEHTTQLYIQPDGMLNYIPFDALLTKEQQLSKDEYPDYSTLPYLLKKIKISYIFSATTWFQQCQLAPSTHNKLVAFAPSFGDARLALQRSSTSEVEMTLGNLKGAKEEVTQIQGIFPSILKVGEAATKDAFLEDMKKAKIIHLATHGLLNENNGAYSSIAFADNGAEDNLLYAFELYGLRMNTDLIVLSACNTALGTWEAGEGVMSLARGFTSTGCKSILMSLWAVADQSASTIIPDFYKYLADGKDKSFALQQAKLNYLQSTDANGAHPYYWASLCLTGDIAPVTEVSFFSDTWLWLISGGLVLGIISFLFLKRR